MTMQRPSHRAIRLRGLYRAAQALVCAALALYCLPVHAQYKESEIKAQIVFRVLLFVQWPPRAAADHAFQFCVLDDTPLSRALRSFEGRPLNERVFTWRQAASDRLAGCDAVYAGQALSERNADLRGMLWIGDELGLLERGAMLNLQVENGKVVFDVGLAAMRRGGLDVSAKVLRLARYVKES